MLDGSQNKLKTFLAQKGVMSVTFQAMNKEEARQLLDDNDMKEYKIVWISTPHDHQ